MSHTNLLAVLVLLLAACAIQPKPFKGPNGGTAYSMGCSDMGRSLNACYQKASELCPNGYDVVNLSTVTIGVPVQGGTLMVPDQNLAIECKGGAK